MAARALAAAGLVTAFGHVSARTGSGEGRNSFLITPPKPLGTLRSDEPLQEVPLAGDGLPDGVPKEAWIHRAIYEARPDVGAICRAQPPVATAVASAGLPMRVLHGHAAFLGRRCLYTATPVSFANARQARRWRGAWAMLEAS